MSQKLYELRDIAQKSLNAINKSLFLPDINTIQVNIEKILTLVTDHLSELERDENIIDRNPRPIIKEADNDIIKNDDPVN